MKIAVIPLLILPSCAVETVPQQSLFQPAVRISLPNKPGNIELADLNNDGRLDLIVTSEEPKAVMVMMGEKGDVPFRPTTARTISLTENPGELAVGDVNGDGRVDLAMDHHDSYNVTLLLGDASGGFSHAPTSPIIMKRGQHPHTHGIGLADFNGDGKLDLATVNNEDNDVSVALGDGRGGFTTAPGSPFAVGPSPYPLAIGDVNKDGRPDIIANASATGPNRAQQLAASKALTVLLADGRGGFRRSDAPLRTVTPWFAATGDVNGDDKPDLVATHHDQSVLSVVLGDGNGNFREVAGSPFDMGHNVSEVVLADVNRDQHLDVIAAAGEGVRVLLGAGSGNFKGTVPVATAFGTWRLALGDINQDNKTDIVTTNTESSSVTVLFGK